MQWRHRIGNQARQLQFFSLAYSELFCANPSRPPSALHTLAAVLLSFIAVVTFVSAFVAIAVKWCAENVVCIRVKLSIGLLQSCFRTEFAVQMNDDNIYKRSFSTMLVAILSLDVCVIDKKHKCMCKCTLTYTIKWSNTIIPWIVTLSVSIYKICFEAVIKSNTNLAVVLVFRFGVIWVVQVCSSSCDNEGTLGVRCQVRTFVQIWFQVLWNPEWAWHHNKASCQLNYCFSNNDAGVASKAIYMPW